MVYSYGHRNVQGLAFDDSGRLWASEFGQNTWDELNLITAGGNYGWPEVEGQGARDGFVDPQRVWPTDEASPSGIAFWQGSIWMAGLRGERLWQIPIDRVRRRTDDRRTGRPPDGRLRPAADRAVAPDGSLWVITSNTDGRGDVRDGDDRILRLDARGLNRCCAHTTLLSTIRDGSRLRRDRHLASASCSSNSTGGGGASYVAGRPWRGRGCRHCRTSGCASGWPTGGAAVGSPGPSAAWRPPCWS